MGLPMSIFGDLDRQLAEITRLLVDANGNSRLQRIERRLSGTENQLDQILTKENRIMATLDQIAADVTAESTMLDGLSTLIGGLRQQVADALASAGMSADDQ